MHTSADRIDLAKLETLRTRLDDSGPLSPAEASSVIDQIAEAVDSAHTRGIHKGPITPESILLLPDGRVRLFCGRRSNDRYSVHQHRVRAIADSAYLAPEEARGDGVVHATEIWWLGALLYELITGRPPFSALGIRALKQAVLESDPVHLESDSRALQDVLDCALAKWPANRYMSAQALANALWASLPQVAVNVPAHTHVRQRHDVPFREAANKAVRFGVMPRSVVRRRRFRLFRQAALRPA